jgi:alpha-ketoglutarate-dependent taurine dioxygenase
MTITFEPCNAVIGARVHGAPLSDIPDTRAREIIEAGLEQYGVLIWSGQNITPAEQVAFSAAFAPLDKPSLVAARHRDHDELFVIGNTGEKPVTFSPASADGALEWHTDHIHHKVPARASLLYALEVPPEGGDTLFACMYSAYDDLSPGEQAEYDRLEVINSVAGLRAYLSGQGYGYVKKELREGLEDAVVHPLVRAHPLTGRKALYFGNQVSIGIVGWDDREAYDFIGRLASRACRSDFRYRHKWHAGDAVLWDNRRVLHAGTAYDMKNHRRTMHRTTWRETEPITLVAG